MSFNAPSPRSVLAFVFAALLMAPATSTRAQWALGPAPSEPARDYIYMVFADPLPGREAEFNDWYQNVHLGDLLQLRGWNGAQRFRLVTAASPRRAEGGYRNGYAVFWDQGGDDIVDIRRRIGSAIAGGKSRRGAAFDYGAGAGSSATFRAAGPRQVRTDGVQPGLPPPEDNVSVRAGRFIYLEFSDLPDAEDEARAMESRLDRRIRQVLQVPGWMAAQRFTFVVLPQTPGGPPFRPYPRALTVWEIEADQAVAAAGALAAATVAGRVEPLDVQGDALLRSSWWEPISPHVTKDDIVR